MMPLHEHPQPIPLEETAARTERIFMNTRSRLFRVLQATKDVQGLLLPSSEEIVTSIVGPFKGKQKQE